MRRARLLFEEVPFVKLLPVLAGALALLSPASSAVAGRQTYQQDTRLTIASMTKSQALAVRDQSAAVLRFYGHHRWLLAPRHRTCWSVPWAKACDRARRDLHRSVLVHRLALQRLAQFLPPWLVSAFLCIHRYEGAWNENSGNGFYGGLQMDRRFQSLYAPEYVARWGTADNWPAWAQIQVAIRAYRSGRGFYPWPNTARACGLI